MKWQKCVASLGLFIMVGAMIGLAVLAAGCAGKLGASAVNSPDGLTSLDPSMEHGTAVLGKETTLISGPMGVETSSLKQTGMEETNSGSALKQRAGFTIGDLKAMLSAASDFDMAGIELVLKDGKVESVKIAKLATSNSEVQRSVNEGALIRVQAWMRASDNEKAVQEAALAAQAKAGDAVASVAQAYIQTLKKASPAGLLVP